MSTVVVIEIAHYLVKKLGPIKGRKKVETLLSFPFIILDFEYKILEEYIEALAEYSPRGISGREATIVASMKDRKIKKLVTHDRAFERIDEIEVIDPVEQG